MYLCPLFHFIVYTLRSLQLSNLPDTRALNPNSMDDHIKKHVVSFIISDFEESADENACLDIFRPLSEELLSLKPQNPLRITAK